MIIKEYLDRDTQNKNRLFVDVECDHCKTLYKRQKRQLNEFHGCSAMCLSFLKGTRVNVTCAHCGTEHSKPANKLDNSKSGLYFCSRKCKDIGQTYIKAIQPEHYGTGSGQYSYRTKALEHYGAKCNRCNYDEHIAAIVVHHIDRDRNNNSLTNLEVLCANCHAIEHWGT